MTTNWSERLKADHAKASALYAAADPATLAALHPVLETQIGRARARLEAATDSERNLEDSTAAFEEMRAEALAVLANRADVDDDRWSQFRAALDALQDAHGDLDRKMRATGREHSAALMSASVMLIDRRRLLEAELVRRGLLPEPIDGAES